MVIEAICLMYVLEGNLGKIAQGGLLPDHPLSPLFNGDPARHRQCPGRLSLVF